MRVEGSGFEGFQGSLSRTSGLQDLGLLGSSGLRGEGVQRLLLFAAYRTYEADSLKGSLFFPRSRTGYEVGFRTVSISGVWLPVHGDGHLHGAVQDRP